MTRQEPAIIKDIALAVLDAAKNVKGSKPSTAIIGLFVAACSLGLTQKNSEKALIDDLKRTIRIIKGIHEPS